MSYRGALLRALSVPDCLMHRHSGIKEISQ